MAFTTMDSVCILGGPMVWKSLPDKLHNSVIWPDQIPQDLTSIYVFGNLT